MGFLFDFWVKWNEASILFSTLILIYNVILSKLFINLKNSILFFQKKDVNNGTYLIRFLWWLNLKYIKHFDLCLVISNSSINVSCNNFILILVLWGFKTNKEALLLNRSLAFFFPSKGGHASKSKWFHVENCWEREAWPVKK